MSDECRLCLKELERMADHLRDVGDADLASRMLSVSLFSLCGLIYAGHLPAIFEHFTQLAEAELEKMGRRSGADDN